MDHRSPLESIFSVISHDKPVKHALYNAVALFLMFLCCAAGYAVYMILEPFIKPLIWAVLVGSALHPLKQSLRYRFQMWLETLEITKTPVILGIVFVPVSTVDSISEFIENASQDYLNNKLTVETVKKIDFDEVAKKKEDLDLDKCTEHNASAKKKTDREKHRNDLDLSISARCAKK
ncbi:hypothetical protein JTB14_027490 [Gonioctena quinquepunctata]|nr:hypothetical protein JTB14_027490 [Gonioctena quinquepunctata]